MAGFLQVENISKSYGDKTLFRNIGFNINEGDKIALIAPNGTGKSSLLKILAGTDSSDRGGEVKFMKDIKVAFLDQNTAFNPDNTVFDEVYSGLGATYDTIRDYERAIASEDQRRIERAMAAFDYAQTDYCLDTAPGRVMYFYYNPEQYFKYIRPVRRR